MGHEFPRANSVSLHDRAALLQRLDVDQGYGSNCVKSNYWRAQPAEKREGTADPIVLCVGRAGGSISQDDTKDVSRSISKDEHPSWRI